MLIHPKFYFVPPDQFKEAADSNCEVQLLEKRQTNHQITNNFHEALNIPSSNSAISLNKSKILKRLVLSKCLEEVNLCARPSSSYGESTSEQVTQSDDSERF